MKNILTFLWANIGLVKIREIGINLYQFVFASQRDKLQILNGKAWTFDSQFIILKPWKENVDFQMESFNKIHMWIQVWHLPNHWMSKESNFKFKNLFSNVVDVIIPESGSNRADIKKS